MSNKVAALGLGFLAVALASSGWWFMYSQLKKEDGEWALLAVFLGGYLIALLILVIISLKYSTAAFFLSLLPVFLFSLNWRFFLVLFLAVGLFYLGAFRIRRYKRNAIQMRISQIVPVGYSLITSALCLVLAAAYFFITQNAKVVKNDFWELKMEIPVEVTEALFDFSKHLPGNNSLIKELDLTVDEMLAKSIIEELKKKNEYGEGMKVSVGEIEEQRKLLANQWEIDLSGDEKMSAVYNQLINSQIALRLNSGEKERDSASVFWMAMGVFLTLKALGWLCRTPLIILAAIIFKLMTKTGILGVRRKQVIAERV